MRNRPSASAALLLAVALTAPVAGQSSDPSASAPPVSPAPATPLAPVVLTGWAEGVVPEDLDPEGRVMLAQFGPDTLLMEVRDESSGPTKAFPTWLTTDGTSWDDDHLEISPSDFVTGLTVLPDGRFLANGYEPATKRKGRVDKLHTYAPGDGWAGPALAPKDADLAAIVRTPTGLHAIGHTLVKKSTAIGQWTSPDGVAWERTVARRGSLPPFLGAVRVAAAGDGRVVAVLTDAMGSMDRVFASADGGVTWTEADFSTGDGVFCRSVIWDGRHFQAAVGDADDTTLRASTDGVTWTITHTEPTRGGQVVRVGDGGAVAFIGTGTLFSSDGATWISLGELPGSPVAVSGGDTGATVLVGTDDGPRILLAR